MKPFRYFLALAAVAGIVFSCEPIDPTPVTPPEGNDEYVSGITYQLNVYSFADSDGDGWGDLKGVTQHLDYFDSLGVTSLWLSPIQTAASYHGYNVLDYYSISPKLGTEADFQDLIDKAKAKHIDIYMDYVLNHSGRGDWFNTAVSSTSNQYSSYYVLSNNWAADVSAGKIDNYAGASNPGMGSWYPIAGGEIGYKGRIHIKVDMNSRTLLVSETTDAAQSPNNSNPECWIWYGSISKHWGLYTTGSKVYEITLDMDTSWGMLVCTSTNWAEGTKWGGDGSSLSFGTPYRLNNSTAADITFGGNSIWYFASFDSSMPDLNYGPYAKASESAAFKDLAASADKWINMGVNGLRLDAVIWIYQNQTTANTTFLKQWYDRCNTTYKARGGEGDIFMVGEAWCDNAEQMAPYYKGLPSNFNFYYWYTLRDRILNGKGCDFAKTVIYFRNLFKGYRSDFIDSIKLTNHDENRAGSDLGRNTAMMKLAGAVLLTSPGKPFVYQGEELGYWGDKSKGDEYIRTPIKWTANSSVPSRALNGKVDNSMLTPAISVESQTDDENSILNVYRKFGQLRNRYKALGIDGEIVRHPDFNESIPESLRSAAVWYRECDGQKVLVVHNFGSSEISLTFKNDKLDNMLASNGEVAVFFKENLQLGPYSSAVFLQ